MSTELTERIESLVTFYDEESQRFHQLYFDQSIQGVKLEECIQYNGYSTSLYVASRGLSDILTRHSGGVAFDGLETEEEIKEALRKEIAGLQYCIELDTKYWIDPTARKPWTKHTDILKYQAQVAKYQDIIEQLTRLVD